MLTCSQSCLLVKILESFVVNRVVIGFLLISVRQPVLLLVCLLSAAHCHLISEAFLVDFSQAYLREMAFVDHTLA